MIAALAVYVLLPIVLGSLVGLVLAWIDPQRKRAA